MKEIKVLDIVRECNGILICGDENVVCSSFSKDTRTLNEGDTYLGIKGETFNGSLLYKEAFKKGANVCIVDDVEITKQDVLECKGKVIIKVDNTVKALQTLAKYKREQYDIPVIGITGSVGKTSTKDIIASVVGMKYKVLKTEGNLNNEIGMPLTILRLEDHEAMVLEMGTDKFGDLSLLTSIAKPNIFVYTIIGTSHIANFGSRENILKGKLEMLESLKSGNAVIVNNDNDLLHGWLEENKEKYIGDGIKVYSYGIEFNSDYTAKNIMLEEFGSKYNIDLNKEYLVEIPVGGKHFVYNSLAAIAIGKYLEISMEDILIGISKFELTKMRMDILKLKNNVVVVNDTYNASYDSMKSGIDYLSKLNNIKKIAILGDMLELGEYSENLHRAVGKSVAENKIDVLVTIGEEAKFIADEAINNGIVKDNIFVCNNIEEAYNVLSKNVNLEDTAILVKASRGMQLERVVSYIKEILN
ncbi:MAG: UDP-N-acetylmuramoyl-tripeptide--D-alanyl-D-alanine ligase [Clostridia bacterium]|nr:UDP-N-acetylmuramoyl-tripeptide--D-alanyl-D-alanine ligase [Clostridia bacterium]